MMNSGEIFMNIPFNRIHKVGKEIEYISVVLSNNNQLQGDGKFTARCNEELTRLTKCKNPLLTNSCTSALDMAAMLCNLRRGDEVIMPSYTFVSTANAFANQGAKIVWCDVRLDTLNIDETKIESLITKNTKVIVPVHYAGVACEMDTINEIARKHKLLVVEDAAQGMCSYYKGRHLGTLSDFGALSFHGTKNITCGEGGALLVNNEEYVLRANIIREKGTNRTEFLQGKADKYGWVDYGSSFLPSEITSAMLLAQLENARVITKKRVSVWKKYFKKLKSLSGKITLPFIPNECDQNAHIFYFLAEDAEVAKSLIVYLKGFGVSASSHYSPLHSSPMGLKITAKANLPISDFVAGSIVRLPIYPDLSDEEISYICDLVKKFFKEA